MTERNAMLGALYAAPGERAQKKQMDRLDRHAKRFIELSPFVVIASADRGGGLDASPRGGVPGFVRAIGDSTLLIPDAPGNNRIDSLSNIADWGRIGLLFLLPGVDETLRVNGAARLSTDAAALARFADERRAPKLVIEVSVEEVYLHCAKALMRSKLWGDAHRVERSVLPSMGQMIKEQAGLDGPAESQQAMLERYRADL